MPRSADPRIMALADLTAGAAGAGLRVDVSEKRHRIPGEAPRPVLAGVAFTAAAHSVTALAGPSGVGKTTLLQLVAGLDREFLGRIDRPAGARLAYVFQEPRLLPWRTVAENLDLATVAAGLPPDDARRDGLLARAGLAGTAGLHPGRLSLGMARRVALVRAFAVRPALLLMDEPFASLDAGTAAELRDLAADLLAQHRATVLLATHEPLDMVRLASRVLVLAGRPAVIVADLTLPPPPPPADRAAQAAAARDLATVLASAYTKMP